MTHYAHIENEARYQAAIDRRIKANRAKTGRAKWLAAHEDAQTIYDWLFSVGEFDSTVLPVPVDVVTPVPPRATDSVPVVPATIGRPVALASDVVLNSSALVIFLVIPPCTMGISSAAVVAEAAGSWEIATVVMVNSSLQRC